MNDDLQVYAQKVASGVPATFVYKLTRLLILFFLWPYLRIKVDGRKNLDGKGALILAPVHRSNLDPLLLAGVLRHRRMRALAKESLFKVKPFAWFVSALGAFPVRRGSADRESVKAARVLLAEGATLLVFPEGTRQEGNEIGELYDGTAYLASKSGVPVVPIGISGTGKAMGSGSRIPKPFKVKIFIGKPILPPSKSIKRSALTEWTSQFHKELQVVQNKASSIS